MDAILKHALNEAMSELVLSLKVTAKFKAELYSSMQVPEDILDDLFDKSKKRDNETLIFQLLQQLKKCEGEPMNVLLKALRNSNQGPLAKMLERKIRLGRLELTSKARAEEKETEKGASENPNLVQAKETDPHQSPRKDETKPEVSQNKRLQAATPPSRTATPPPSATTPTPPAANGGGARRHPVLHLDNANMKPSRSPQPPAEEAKREKERLPEASATANGNGGETSVETPEAEDLTNKSTVASLAHQEDASRETAVKPLCESKSIEEVRALLKEIMPPVAEHTQMNDVVIRARYLSKCYEFIRGKRDKLPGPFETVQDQRMGMMFETHAGIRPEAGAKMCRLLGGKTGYTFQQKFGGLCVVSTLDGSIKFVGARLFIQPADQKIGEVLLRAHDSVGDTISSIVGYFPSKIRSKGASKEEIKPGTAVLSWFKYTDSAHLDIWS